MPNEWLKCLVGARRHTQTQRIHKSHTQMHFHQSNVKVKCVKANKIYIQVCIFMAPSAKMNDSLSQSINTIFNLLNESIFDSLRKCYELEYGRKRERKGKAYKKIEEKKDIDEDFSSHITPRVPYSGNTRVRNEPESMLPYPHLQHSLSTSMLGIHNRFSINIIPEAFHFS